MDITVCIKHVPDVSAPFRVQDGELVFDTGRHVLNAYDASAVEAALVLREEHGGTVRVVSVGPEGASETIRKALAMGADEGVHLHVEDDEQFDAFAYATVLAAHLKDGEWDAIFCGKQSQDTDAGLTGSMLAALLDLPYATNAVGLSIDDNASALIVERQGDLGTEVLELPPPCLVTCSNDMNDPRIPKLKGIMQAKRKPLEKVAVGDLAVEAQPRTTIVGYEAMPEREPGEMLEGEPDEMVASIVQHLDEDGVL